MSQGFFGEQEWERGSANGGAQKVSHLKGTGAGTGEHERGNAKSVTFEE